jgi:predicted PurR-regulated permease PerM
VNSSSTLNTVLISVVVVAILFLAREVLIPISLACILSFMLAPPVRILQALHVPRGLAVLAVVLTAFAGLFALGGIMARNVTRLAGDLPRYEATISAKIQGLRGTESGTTGTLERARSVLENLGKELAISEKAPAQPERRLQSEPIGGTDRALIPVEVHEPSGDSLQMLTRLISPLLGPLATTGIIIVFVIFILIQREDLRNRLIRLAGSTDIPHTTAALDDAAHRLSRLFLTQLAINTGFAILVGLGLWCIGIPSPFVWAALSGVLRFVPYIGSILGMVFPLTLALSVDPGWSMALWTAALFLGLEAVTGQVIEPIVEGHSTGLSPVAVVVAATFWAWLWGPIGLVLATPLTVILVVLGRHVEALKFFDVLFGDEPALSEAESFYQRMLARDPVEAVEQAKSFMAMHSLAGYCDEVARPGLILAQKDAERGLLEESNRRNMVETVEALFSDIAHEHWLAKKEAHASTLASVAKLPTLHQDQLASTWRSSKPLLVIGVYSELDAAAAAILATLAETHGISTRVERSEVLAAANLAKLDLSDTALICLCSVDIKTPARIHYAARRLKSRAPHAALLVGVCSATDEQAIAGLKDAVNADYTSCSFHEAATIILQEATAKQDPRAQRLRSGRVAPHPPGTGETKELAQELPRTI